MPILVDDPDSASGKRLERGPFPKLKTWFECVEERDAEIARLRGALHWIAYGSKDDPVPDLDECIDKAREALKE